MARMRQGIADVPPPSHCEAPAQRHTRLAVTWPAAQRAALRGALPRAALAAPLSSRSLLLSARGARACVRRALACAAMWPAAGGGDERVGVVKLRFSKAELAAAAAEFAPDDDYLFGGGFGGSDGVEPPLPATADHDGFDFDRRGARIRRPRPAPGAPRKRLHAAAVLARGRARLTRPRDGAGRSRTRTRCRRRRSCASRSRRKS